MTAAEVIDEIKQLPPGDQAEVIQFTIELGRHRELSPRELGDLAERLAQSEDPAEIARLKSAMTRGFYGGVSEARFKSPSARRRRMRARRPRSPDRGI